MNWTYKGQTIKVSHRGLFEIEWADDMESQSVDHQFGSKGEAEEAIDHAVTLKAKKLTVNYAVLRPDGVAATLTGINRNTSYVIMKPDDHPSRFSSFNEAYPDLPVVKELLDKVNELEKEISELKIPLGKMEIKFNIGFGRIAPEDYSTNLASLAERVDKAYKEARKLIPTT